MLVYEGIGVACDQWFGATAESGTPFASMALVPVFLALAAIGSAPLVFYYRNLDRAPDPDAGPVDNRSRDPRERGRVNP